MQIPHIQMQSQSAQITIKTTDAQMKIQQSNADMRIKQPSGEMNIRTTPGRLTIDQTQAWEDMDIKSISKRVRENVFKAKQALMDGIARVASEGDEMIEIHTGRDAIVEQAARINNPPPAASNIMWAPSNFSVKIHYESAKTDIQYNQKQPIIDARVRKPIISYQRGDVQISLQQRNSLQIDFVK